MLADFFRRGHWFKSCYDFTFSIDQELGEVPANIRLAVGVRLFRFEPFIQLTGVLAVDVNL